ncbi:MAG: T9SS type A sorting domain-containing protein, partial [Calditrichia bacterium]
IFIWVEQGQGLRIMLKQILKNGNLGEIITLIKNNQNDYMPKNSELYQNYPNPFNPVTTITYQLPVASKVRLEIYNILGQKVRTLVDAQQPAEYYTIQWDGKNDHGRQVGSGLYIYRLITETADGGERFVKARKMLLIR